MLPAIKEIALYKSSENGHNIDNDLPRKKGFWMTWHMTIYTGLGLYLCKGYQTIDQRLILVTCQERNSMGVWSNFPYRLRYRLFKKGVLTSTYHQKIDKNRLYIIYLKRFTWGHITIFSVKNETNVTLFNQNS